MRKSEIVRTDNEIYRVCNECQLRFHFWNDFATGVRRQAAASEIKKITVLDPSRRAKQGMITGATLLGGPAIIWALTNGLCPDEIAMGCNILKVTSFWPRFAGGLGGGYLHGSPNAHREVFVFGE